MKFRNGSILVEAIQYKRGRAVAVFDVCGSMGFNCDEDGRLWYFASDHEWAGNPDDWIIKSADGKLSRCKPAIFTATYEPILE